MTVAPYELPADYVPDLRDWTEWADTRTWADLPDASPVAPGPDHADHAQDEQPKKRRHPLLTALILVMLPVLVPVFVVWSFLVRLQPAADWLARNVEDRGPHSFWGAPKAEQVHALLKHHGCYYLHGELGSGKTMGVVVLGLLMAWHQATQHDGPQMLFFNLTVNEYRCRLLLLKMGCPSSIVNRIHIEQFSIMDQRQTTHEHVWRRRWSVICCDEIPYYMEDDKKTVRSLLLRAFRMARRRNQIVLGVGQELIHSRYRPLFRLRGHCSQAFGRMKIVWRGAQDPVSSQKPTKPQAVTAYGLDLRRIAACYDTWEDLEDLDDDAPPAPVARKVRGAA